MGFFSSDSREPSKQLLALRGLVAIATVAAILTGLTLVAKGTFSSSVPAVARVDTVGGSLIPGGDVKLHGVLVGEVASIRKHGELVDVRLNLEKEHVETIPAAVTARVLPNTIFGTSYVELLPQPSASRETLAADQVIPQDKSGETLDLQTALDTIHRVLIAVRPAELATTLNTLAAALEGRGEQIADMIGDAENFLSTKINPNMPLFRKDLRMLAEALAVIEQHTPKVLDAVDDIVVGARTIVQKRADIARMIAGGTTLVEDTYTLFRENEQRYVASIDGISGSVDLLYDERDNHQPAYRSLFVLARQLTTVLDDGAWANVDGVFQTFEPAADKIYTSADCPRYHQAEGSNCRDGASRSSSTGRTTQRSAPPVDSALLGEVLARLGTVRRAESRGSDIGAYLTGPLLEDAEVVLQ